MSGLRKLPRCLGLAGVLALATSASAPAGASDSFYTGTVVVTGHVTLGANVAANDTLTAYVSIGEMTASKVAIQGISFPAKLTRSGSLATFSARVPYKWFIESSTLSQVVVNVGASVSGSATSASTGSNIPLPATGATTSLYFKLAM